MKKISILLLTVLSGTAVFAQQAVNLEHKGMIAKEMASHKMPVGNINNNTQNYDLRYQRLDLTLDPAILNVNGSVTSHFIPNQSMTSIYFDLTPQIPVSQVSFHGTSLPFQQLPTNELKIDFLSALPANTLDSLTVHYAGTPPAANQAFRTSTQNGNPVLFTLSEPYGAQDWFPTKQSMNDKIETFVFKINTPSQYSVAANGRLLSETLLPNSRKLTHWKTQYPMAAYLAAFSITNFTKINDVIGTPPFPFVNYLYPSTAANTTAMSNIEWTKQAMNTFETYFGAYPFRNEKYGHMEFGFTGTCMEHQTMSSMSSWGRAVIAHELAHQWFGDKITCGAWNDIWLNEGFATFGEHLVNEKLLMTPANFKNYLLGQKNYVTSSPGGTLYVSDANLANQNAIFSSRLSYAKGGYVVRMLKWILGDAPFYAAIQDYLNRPNLAYGYAKSTDLKASLQQSTGTDFTEFFNDWLYGQGYPTYTISWKQNATNLLTIKADQTTSHTSVPFYEMPLPIKVSGTAGEVAYHRPQHIFSGQYFTFQVPFTVSSVEFNYDYQILENNSTVAFDNALSTAETELTELQVYPVPARDEIFVKGFSGTEAFTITGADGRLLKSGKTAAEKAIDVRNFAPGVYFIKIKDRAFKFIRK